MDGTQSTSYPSAAVQPVALTIASPPDARRAAVEQPLDGADAGLAEGLRCASVSVCSRPQRHRPGRRRAGRSARPRPRACAAASDVVRLSSRRRAAGRPTTATSGSASRPRTTSNHRSPPSGIRSSGSSSKVRGSRCRQTALKYAAAAEPRRGVRRLGRLLEVPVPQQRLGLRDGAVGRGRAAGAGTSAARSRCGCRTASAARRRPQLPGGRRADQLVDALAAVAVRPVVGEQVRVAGPTTAWLAVTM